MIQFECKQNVETRKITDAANRGSLKALPRAAAYVRGVARRKVKRRKRKSSAPGQPPFAHSGVFKPSILYGVEKADVTAYIGPQRLAEKRTNFAGQPVSEILEFGGMAALGKNSNWFHTRNVPNLRNIQQVADYFQKIGVGPGYWGLTLNSIQAKMDKGGRGKTEEAARGKGGSGSNAQYQRYKRYSPIKGRQVYLANIRIYSATQAMKVAKTVVEVFGYPVTNRPIKIAPRPLMGPSLADSQSQLAKFWENTL